MPLQEDPLTALRHQLHHLPCPTCGSRELMPVLQCDYYPDGCLWFIRCAHCLAQYHLDHRSVPAWADTQHASEKMAQLGDPALVTETKGGTHANL
jgi:hypothetical protein